LREIRERGSDDRDLRSTLLDLTAVWNLRVFEVNRGGAVDWLLSVQCRWFGLERYVPGMQAMRTRRRRLAGFWKS